MAYQKDISAVLGLSVSTVSKALKGYPDISEETKRKVLRAAEELDYNYGRDSRKRQGARLWGAVGLLAPGSADLLSSPYYRDFLCGVTEEAAKNNRDLVVMGDDLAEQEMSWIARVTARKVDGICLLASREDFYKGRFADLLNSNIPLVSVENEVAGHTSICRDLRRNAALIMQYLQKRGHRLTALAGGQNIVYRKCASILREEAQPLGMECLLMDPEEMSAGNAAAFLAHTGITCIIFACFREASLWMNRWKEKGLKVPEDLSVVVVQTGCEEYGGNSDRITNISSASVELGRAAVRGLVHILEHPEMDIGETIFLTGTITEGETVRDISGNSARNF